MTITWTNPKDVPAGTIVVGWDGSRHAYWALAWAVDQAVGERRPITVAHTVAPSVAGEAIVWGDGDQLQQIGEAILAGARSYLDSHGSGLEAHALVTVGEPRRILTELSRHAAMLVVGSHGRGPVRSKVVGSVGVAVVRDAACPVTVVRPYRPGIVRRGVLTAVDLADETATTVAERGFHEASVLQLPLTVVHSVPAGSTPLVVARARRHLSEGLAGLRESYPDVHCTAVVQQGGTEDVVLDQAANRHLTVLGSSRGPGRHRSTTVSRIVERSTNPVLVVPHGSDVGHHHSGAGGAPGQAGATR